VLQELPELYSHWRSPEVHAGVNVGSSHVFDALASAQTTLWRRAFCRRCALPVERLVL
jgi:hypothetical protein